MECGNRAFYTRRDGDDTDRSGNFCNRNLPKEEKMSYTQDKRTGKFAVRAKIDGKWKYIGSYSEEHDAMEISIRHQIAEEIKQHTLENYQMELETHDESMDRLLKPFKDWLKERTRKKKSQKINKILDGADVQTK